MYKRERLFQTPEYQAKQLTSQQLDRKWTVYVHTSLPDKFKGHTSSAETVCLWNVYDTSLYNSRVTRRKTACSTVFCATICLLIVSKDAFFDVQEFLNFLYSKMNGYLWRKSLSHHVWLFVWRARSSLIMCDFKKVSLNHIWLVRVLQTDTFHILA